MRRWAESGGMWLTGTPDGAPLAPPHRIAAALDEALAPFGLDASLLGWRAAYAGLGRQGSVSCGGATRLYRAADGWVALALSRPEDVEMLPALVGVTGVEDVAAAVLDRSASEVVATAELLGVPCASPSEGAPIPFSVAGTPGTVGDRAPVVIDLSALWAGPLCAQLLRRAGAHVIKVESAGRPDGARRGAAGFFDALHAGVTDHPMGPDLPELIASADVVITSGRARAIDQLGIDPGAGATDRVWVAITGHGYASNRVGFGDDAAVAGGLVAWVDDQPHFVADAVADPLTGALAAAAALRCVLAGGRWFVDASMAGAAASVAVAGAAVRATRSRRDWVAADGTVVAPPRGLANDPGSTRSFRERNP